MRIKTKEDRRDRIKHRIRKRVRGGGERPRLTVFRSVAHMYVQVVDDSTGRTIASASTVEPALKGALPQAARGGNVELEADFSPDAERELSLCRSAATAGASPPRHPGLGGRRGVPQRCPEPTATTGRV